MVNYAEEARQLAAENQRRMSLLLDEIQAINEQTAATGREFADRLTADMDQFWATHAAELDKAAAEAEAQRRLEDEAREQREAVARSMAARRANQTVAPVDEEDEEAKFYQRKSWLI
ncbi:hypothetical protein IU486_21670 [Streptomyces gardneri]|uniref:hypothetical protein n=1 Tax=Nocardia TaxID=1817 RepID=UPI001357D975|nr:MULTISPECIES: hypothetical protein [Nocardia]MBF6167342.1 hypothetical protein [Streptomyces gardneri]MBF6204571.1 hypothetical protein [Streptomyces gardneri]UAK33106.1 hypothetical protein K8O92_03655 [Nocardia asteroides]